MITFFPLIQTTKTMCICTSICISLFKLTLHSRFISLHSIPISRFFSLFTSLPQFLNITECKYVYMLKIIPPFIICSKHVVGVFPLLHPYSTCFTPHFHFLLFPHLPRSVHSISTKIYISCSLYFATCPNNVD